MDDTYETLGLDLKSGEIIKENWKTNPYWPSDKKLPDFIDPDGRILRSVNLEAILMSESGFTQRERCKALVSILERQRDFKEEPLKLLTFGEALEILKVGGRVSRNGWNGKGMFLFLLPGGDVPKSAIHDPKLREVIDAEVDGDTFVGLPSIRMWTVNSEGRKGILTGWLASQTDMLSEDWIELS